ncbi:LVIVD repeat-containing protein [Aureicoccus marinus]|uniref:LVIVD repeat-containing protein n=1 Tax=Aureicoccus marinus TaxID=754435 RepID=A0A2S7TAQ1_9FLAO|nr:hypothetical protein [Aureicoccus marinus]PQJ16608.1 hypothetical protein BST99_13575 [Aureicoccus marinus]
MKIFKPLMAVLVIALLSSCEKKTEFAEYLVARPLIMTKADFITSVDILPPQPIEESGKIYTYQDMIFINDKYEGIHVIDNSNPASPQKIAYISLAGTVDISIKDDVLYADSIRDLVLFDISDISNIQEISRMENVLQDNVIWPFDADIIEWVEYDYENELIVGWETTTEIRRVEQTRNFGGLDDIAIAENADSGGTGQGGSLARFKIVGDHLYAVDQTSINLFDISDVSNPVEGQDVFVSFDIETIFNRGDHLFLGGQRGMYIYDITDPAFPAYVSEFQHGTACDPVVVDGDYAYVTLRGGNTCGAVESGLYIVDISTIENPTLAVQYPMDEPHGLGIKDEKLFICDGASGLKVFDKTDIMGLTTLDVFSDIVTFDVIPQEDRLLLVGDDVLTQFTYTESGLNLLSSFALD